MADLDLSGHSFTTAVIAPDMSRDIGYQGTPFTGSFHGNGHRISNLTIDLLGDSDPANNTNQLLGLFGIIGDGGDIRDLVVENFKIFGGMIIGGLAGQNYGTIQSCHSIVNLRTINTIGGLVGENFGTITTCSAVGVVDCDGAGGGLVGTNGGIISFSKADCLISRIYTGSDYGQSLGGLVGGNAEGEILSCYAAGSVSGNSELGGLVGNNERGTISWSYAVGTVDRVENSGGLVGWNDRGTVVSSLWDLQTSDQPGSMGGMGLTTEQMKTRSVLANAGWAGHGWVMGDGGDYPRLACENPTGTEIPSADPIPLLGSGTETDPFQIWTIEDLCRLNQFLSILEQHIVLMSDLDMTGYELVPLGSLAPFTGVFDGNGRVIHNLRMDRPFGGYTGLFGTLGTGGRIENLSIKNGWFRGLQYVGALAGWNENRIVRRCHSKSTLAGITVGGLIGYNHSGLIFESDTTGTVDGQWYGGGLVGDNELGIISSCFATNRVESALDAGGLVGINTGTASCCYAIGAVGGFMYIGGFVGDNDMGTITNCYSAGTAEGTWYYHGFSGISSGPIHFCFWDSQTSGQTVGDAELIGKTTAEMMTRATFTDAGWDFVEETVNGTGDVWRMCEDGKAYPRLSWEFSRGGDLNCPDGVGMEDLVYLAQRWMKTTSTGAGAADGNGDGRVDLSDFEILADNWMRM